MGREHPHVTAGARGPQETLLRFVPYQGPPEVTFYGLPPGLRSSAVSSRQEARGGVAVESLRDTTTSISWTSR